MDLTPAERAALDYCAPLGIPLSVFLGRVVYPGDPQWTERDASAALWWKSNICGGCGQLLSETLADASDDPRIAFQWRAEGVTCHGCGAIHREGLLMAGRNPYKDADPTAGARFIVTYTPLDREEAA